jgi:negative regulator of sigma E activity
VVVTVWEGRSEAEVMQVEHAGDMMMLGGDATATLIGEGRVMVDGTAGVALDGWSVPDLRDRYRADDITDMRRLGRPARSVTVYEGDLVRARIIFDLETWAPLATEIYDGDGELFRFATFTEFDANPRLVFDAMQQDGYDYDVVTMADDSTLPQEAGGYARVDAYRGPDEIAHAFFSDGLFSFSVFQVSPQRSMARFADAESMTVADASYLVIVNPTEVWVTWEHGDQAYVLVGDLPPDHLDAVLTDLPLPKGMGFFERLLSLFG